MKPPVCPTWCVEDYVSDDGTANHSGPPNRTVCGESAWNGDHVIVAVWPELRVTTSEARAVGVIEKKSDNDVELSSWQLRELAQHLVAVAELVDAANGVRR